MSVQFEVKNSVGYATLARESALNSLNLEMVQSLYAQLQAWEVDPTIQVVVLRGLGPKSFCAGGDVKTVCLEAKAGNLNYGKDFFRIEYDLDFKIHTYSKPLAVVGHGIVMGGGLGLMIGAHCRVLTEKTTIAMPEITIGLFPDVGVSHALSRMPNHLGLFLALTGARIQAKDAIELGLGDVVIEESKIPGFFTALETHPLSSKAELKSLASHFGTLPEELNLPSVFSSEVKIQIQNALSSSNPNTVFEELSKLRNSPNPFLAKAAETFRKGSPTSAHLIFEQLRRAKNLDLPGVFAQDLRLAVACCQGHDFCEGVRALLIDKDQKPQWRPETWNQVLPERLEAHFQTQI